MARYRKRPVVIEAVQVRLAGLPMERPQWLVDAIGDGRVYWQGGDAPRYTIETLEGSTRASVGDWIVRGVAGELYSVRDDIFRETYDPVTNQGKPSFGDNEDKADMRDDKITSDGCVSFTVPASGRRYKIHVADWESIKLHMEIAETLAADPKNNPPTSASQ